MNKTGAKQLTPNEALNRWKDTEQGRNALSHMSAGELAWDALGATGGGLLGYMLSGLGSGGRSKKRRLLYTLLGATGGGVGTQLALSAIPGGDGFDGSLRDKIRLFGMPEWREVANGDSATIDKEGPLWRYLDKDRLKNSLMPGYFNSSAAALGGLQGWRGKGIDFSGRRAMQAAFEDLANSAYGGRTSKAFKDLQAGKAREVKALAKGDRAQRRLYDRRSQIRQKGIGTGELDVGLGAKALDAAGNAASAYLLASGLEYAARTYGVRPAAYSPSLDPDRIGR